MKNELRKSQLRQLFDRAARLCVFQSTVSDSISDGYLDDMLTVTDDNGDYPIVCALGEEPLSLLIERCSAIGGDANIFVHGAKGVSLLASRSGSSQLPTAKIVDLADPEEWQNGDAAIDLFLEYLALSESKIAKVPGSLPCTLDLYNEEIQLKPGEENEELTKKLEKMEALIGA